MPSISLRLVLFSILRSLTPRLMSHATFAKKTRSSKNNQLNNPIAIFNNPIIFLV